MNKQFDFPSQSDIRNGSEYSSKWETTGRYFNIWYSRDLLGDMVVIRKWGSKNSRRHGGKMDLVYSAEQLEDFVRAIEQRRVRNGYRRIV